MPWYSEEAPFSAVPRAVLRIQAPALTAIRGHVCIERIAVAQRVAAVST